MMKARQRAAGGWKWQIRQKIQTKIRQKADDESETRGHRRMEMLKNETKKSDKIGQKSDDENETNVRRRLEMEKFRQKNQTAQMFR